MPRTNRTGATWRRIAVAAACAIALSAFPDEPESSPTFVSLRPKENSFWTTATNATMAVPLDFPKDASSATLRICGVSYTNEIRGIAPLPTFSGGYVVSLPPATKPREENVYDLTLTFDDGTVRTAKLGLVQGLMPDGEGWTRCIAPAGSGRWSCVVDRAVIPIPYGMTSFTVDGLEIDTGLDGAQGWYALGGMGAGRSVDLALSAEGGAFAATLVGGSDGTLILFH